MTEHSLASSAPHTLQNLLTNATLNPQNTLLEAISAIERSQMQVALVLNEQNKLLGLVLDGDVRRALLAGHNLNDSIDQVYIRDFIRVDPQAGRAEVVELMQSRQVRHVPVVDQLGRLVGMHLWSHMLSRQPRPNSAVILAGGLGRRLYPLTRDVPKPMLKVAGRPILERILLHLIGHGLHDFYVAINYLGDVIRQYFKDGSQLGCRIRYLEENEPLGTGGPLSLIKDELKQPVLVMNGDLITQFNVSQMLDCHQELGNVATVATRLYQHTIPFGCLVMRNGQLQDLEEKPTIVRHINAGIYVLEPRALEHVPKSQNFPITKLLEKLIGSGGKVGCFELQDDWIDVGQKQELELARGE